MRLPAGGAVSGWAALRLAGANLCDGLAPDGRTVLPVPLVGPPGSNFRVGPGAVRHRARLPVSEIELRYGVPVTTPCRALFDAMKWADDLREAVVVGDVAFAARVVDRRAFARSLRDRTGAAGIDLVCEAFDLTEDRSRSPAETRMRLIWRLDAHLPRPWCNWPIADLSGRRLGRPDLLSEELGVVGEFDGADHRGIAVQAEDVDKESAYRNVGLEVFRVVGRDLGDLPRVVRRMHDAVRRAAEADRPRHWLRRTDPGPL